ncbi:MAG: amidohydrolase [Nitrososphaerales archaeon]|nr:amidohydrolase [Nitrososphaerales archaeon]
MKLLIERCSFWPDGSGSVLVSEGLVEGVSQDETLPASDGTVRLDAAGGTLLPGLVDSHCHPFELGWLKRNVDLRGTGNITALRLRVSGKAQRSAPGDWVVGMGWDQEALSERRFPNRWDLDDITPQNPVILGRVCGHIGLVNTRAIEALGLEAHVSEEYERDASGTLTGIVKERALVGAYARLPGKSAATCIADISSVEVDASKLGLTSLHTIVSQDEFKEELEALSLLQREGRLLLKHRVYIPPDAVDYVGRLGSRLNSEGAKINGIKLYADGSLGARTAALREPYSDDPANSGLLRYTDEELTTLANDADSKGYQVIVHAIGDRAVEQTIAALAPLTGRGNPRRHRIEHASLLPKELRSKVKKHDIRVAVQPSFIVSDTWARQRLGEDRTEDLYPLRSLMKDGILTSAGSDAPVETLNPLIGMWAAMVRAGYGAREVLDTQQAVAMYTTNGASNGHDKAVARVSAGITADLTLLDSDIRDMHPALLRKVAVLATIVGGRLAHSYAA